MLRQRARTATRPERRLAAHTWVVGGTAIDCQRTCSCVGTEEGLSGVNLQVKPSLSLESYLNCKRLRMESSLQEQQFLLLRDYRESHESVQNIEIVARLSALTSECSLAVAKAGQYSSHSLLEILNKYAFSQARELLHDRRKLDGEAGEGANL